MVRHSDMRALRYCNKGGREFFQRHGLDWATFVADGVTSSVLEELNDAMADAVVAHARKRLEV